MRFFPIFLLLCLFQSGSCVTERDVLLDAIHTGSTATRIKALEKVASLKWDNRAEDAVVRALNDSSPLVRRTAAEALAGRGISVGWPLARRLRDSDVRVRLQVVRSLHTLPEADFIIIALMGAFADASQQVRTENLDGFVKRGWTLEEILAWRTFDMRLSALEQLTAHSPMDQAAGLEKLAGIRQAQDFAFFYAALYGTDPFLVQVASRALARGGEPEHLDLLLNTPGPEPEARLTLWLENTSSLAPPTFFRLLPMIPEEFFSDWVRNREITLSCEILQERFPLFLIPKLPQNCQAPENAPLAVRYLVSLHNGKVTQELTRQVFEDLDSFDATGLKLLAADASNQPQLVQWFRERWELYIRDFEKWLPENSWRALELVGMEDLEPASSSTSPTERILNAYRARSNVVEETELIPPDFDVPGYAARLQALEGISQARELVLSMLEIAPGPVLASALDVLASITTPGQELPDAVKNAMASEESAVRNAAVRVLAKARHIPELLGLLRTSEPSVVDIILSALETTADETVAGSLFALFQEEPTARLALALARLGAPGIREELFGLLAEDTVLAMSADRALLLAAFQQAGPVDEAGLQVFRRDLWHPSPVVRCEALKHLPPEAALPLGLADPSFQVRLCAQERTKK